MGLGVVLVALGLFMVFSPVPTEDPEPSCGDRPAIAVALGSPTATYQYSGEGDWCRDEAGDQVMGGIVLALPGVLLLAWQARRAWRARRGLRPDATATVAANTYRIRSVPVGPGLERVAPFDAVIDAAGPRSAPLPEPVAERPFGSAGPPPPGPPPSDWVIDERRGARRFRPGRWFFSGLGLVLLAFGLFMVFSPVITEDSEPSCGDRPAIAMILGSPMATSRDAGDRDWCRDEAGGQVVGGIVMVALPGALILAWQGRRAWRARRAPEDLRPDGAGIARTPDGREPARPFRRLPGRLVPTQNQVWLVVEDRPDKSTLLITGRHRRGLPLAAREFDVAGDTSRRVTFRDPGTAKEFVARPDGADRLCHWWTARSPRRHGVSLAGDLYGPPSQPSAVVASLPRPDPLQPAWAHPPARGSLRRALRSAGLMLAAALLSALVILWAAVSDQDWFWEVSDHGESKGLSLAHMSGFGAAFLAVAGVVGISRFLRRRDVLRRQPWELADITTPEFRQVVLRQHVGAPGPPTYRLLGFDEKAGVRVLACKQLWFARGDGGWLVAATPDFRTMVWLRPEPAATPPWPGVDARHSAVIGPQDAPAPPEQPHDHGA